MENNKQLSMAQTIAATKTEFCMLVQIADAYFYILVPGEKMMLFKKALSAQQIDLKKYGRVIAQGKGKPSKSVIRHMEFTYGYNHEDAVAIAA